MVVWFVDHRHIGTIIVCIGSSTVPATGSFRWQSNASNGVIFVGVLAQILVFVRRSRAFGDACDYVTLVHTFHHWQFFLYTYGAVERQLFYL